MLRRGMLTLGVLVGLTGTVSALTLDPLAGWMVAADLDKAVELAKRKDCPIVLLYAPHEGGKEVSVARVFMREADKSLGGMVRVLIYQSVRPPSILQKLAAQVEEPDDALPIMYFATPELKILGFVQSGAHRKTTIRVAEFVNSTLAWIKKSRAEIEAAGKDAANGRFGTALKTLQRISEEDKQRAVAVTSTWNITISKSDVTTFYFPDLPTKIAELGPMADARYEKAKDAFDRKDYAEARKLLFPMITDKSDLEASKRAAELFPKVEEALKQKP